MPLTAALIDQVDKNIRSILGRTKIPGMVAGIVYEGEVAWLKGFGLANISTEKPVTPDSVFRIASISKVVTALAIMQLVDDGKISLDDAANDHLTQFKIKPARVDDPPITIRHLLTHTAGIGELAPILSYANYRSPFGIALKRQSLISLPDFYANRMRAETSPDQKWSYANHGFAILGQLVADVSESTFSDVTCKRIFNPLGMTSSNFLRQPELEDKLVTGYWDVQVLNQIRPVLDVNIITLADGSLFTTGSDFAKFLVALSTDGGGILHPMQLKKMFLPYFQLDSRLSAMGLGVMLESRPRWNGHRVALHDGLWLGFHSSMYLAPKQGIGVFAFANGPGNGAIQAAYQAMRIVLPDSKATFPKKQPHLRENWSELTGSYQPDKGWNTNFRLLVGHGGRFTISIIDDQLILKSRYGTWRKGVALYGADPHDRLAYMTASGVPIIFYRDKRSGRIAGFYMRFHNLIKQETHDSRISA